MTTPVTVQEAQSILQSFERYQGCGLTKLQELFFERDHASDGGRRTCIIGRTSSGKTLIPLLCYEAACRRTKVPQNLLYLVPYRALARQKADDAAELFPGRTILISTTEYCTSDSIIRAGTCDIAIIIYEKAYFFQTQDAHFLARYQHIVFDEIGLVENLERGLKADYLLQEACRAKETSLYLLASYYDWTPYTEAYGFDPPIRSEERPVDMKEEPRYCVPFPHEEFQEAKGADAAAEKEARAAFITASRKEHLFELCGRHWRSGDKILIFINNKQEAQRLARDIYHHFVDTGQLHRDASRTAASYRDEYLRALGVPESDTGGVFTDEDYETYHYGITFHHASLMDEMRDLCERDFLADDGRISIVVATETLAFGLNSNVDVVIIADMTKWERGTHRPRFLTRYEYENYVGRAGRLGRRQGRSDPCGHAYALLSANQKTAWQQLTEQENEWEELRRMGKHPERIRSCYDGIFHEEVLKQEAPFHLLPYFRTEPQADPAVDARTVFARLCQYPTLRRAPLSYDVFLGILKSMEFMKLLRCCDGPQPGVEDAASGENAKSENDVMCGGTDEYEADDEYEVDEAAEASQEDAEDGGASDGAAKAPGISSLPAHYYRLTATGTCALGFVLPKKTFAELEKRFHDLSNRHAFLPFDVIYWLSASDYMMEHSAAPFLPDIPAYDALMESLCDMVASIHAVEDQMSLSLFYRIKKNIEGLQKIRARYGDNFRPAWIGKGCKHTLQTLRTSILLYLWSDSRSVSYLSDTFDDVDYNSLQFAGMKEQYLLEGIRRNPACRLTTGDARHLQYLGPSLYYGVARDLIEAYGTVNLDPQAARVLRTAAIYRNIKQLKNGWVDPEARARLKDVLIGYQAQYPDLSSIIEECISCQTKKTRCKHEKKH